VGAVEVASDRALEVHAPPPIFIEAILLVGERARQRLANECLLGLEVGRERPFGQTGLGHDPADPGGRDAISPDALRRYIDDVPSRRRLVTLLKAHRFFPFFSPHWRAYVSAASSIIDWPKRLGA
jgi:hypothetical protein